METSKIKSRIKKTDLSISIILLVGILAVINYFSYDIFRRADLTENKIYSISKASKDTVGDLEDIINIKAYFSGGLPSQLLVTRREIEDVLDEYVAYSGGKIKVEYIDPDKEPELKQKLAFQGIQELTFEVLEKDRQELRKGYMALTISAGTKIEAIPMLKQDVSGLEYQLTSKIKKVTNNDEGTVAFLSSHGAKSMETELAKAVEALRDLYTVEEAKLEEKDPKINEEVKTLIIAGAKDKFNEDQQKAINEFVKRGGSLVVLMDGVAIGEGLTTAPNESGLETLLAKYGITVNKDLVADPQSGLASFSQGFFSFSTPYPFWPKIIEDGFSSEYAAVSSLESVILPWASTVSYDQDKQAGAKFVDILMSSEKSWVIKDNFQIMPNQEIKPSGEQKRQTLAVALSGEMKDPYGKEGDAKFQGRIVVVGDSDFATDGFVSNNEDNKNLFLNLVDSVSIDNALIEIRSKTASTRPIDITDLSDSKRATLRYLNVFGVTALVIAFGVGRYYLRRRSRFTDDL